MAAKEKIIGIILVLIGALPFLLKIESINNLLGQYTFLLPGEIIYQLIIIILGIFLVISKRRYDY